MKTKPKLTKSGVVRAFYDDATLALSGIDAEWPDDLKERHADWIASLRKGPTLPPALRGIAPAERATPEEVEFFKYLVADDDFGGAWNDAEQINMHCD